MRATRATLRWRHGFRHGLLQPGGEREAGAKFRGAVVKLLGGMRAVDWSQWGRHHSSGHSWRLCSFPSDAEEEEAPQFCKERRHRAAGNRGGGGVGGVGGGGGGVGRRSWTLRPGERERGVGREHGRRQRRGVGSELAIDGRRLDTIGLTRRTHEREEQQRRPPPTVLALHLCLAAGGGRAARWDGQPEKTREAVLSSAAIGVPKTGRPSARFGSC